MFIKLLQFCCKVEEIMNFTQTDLIPEDVMMLDVHDSIFLWIGNNSNKEERDKAVTMAMEYLRTGDYKIYKYYEHRAFIIS
jgi:Gelsolin repeat.